MSTNLPPSLKTHTITGTAGHATINLGFDEAMERGSGAVIVTDGAIQTVIDRATGLPTLRVVGATDTHEIPLSMVGIDGSHVTINADGLTPGHDYRVFIAPGVLQSNGLPFAGVTSSSLLAFHAAADTTPPALLQIGTDNNLLSSGKGATLTLQFSEAVHVDQSAFVAPNVTVTGLAGSADGMTWHATITPVPGIEIASTTVSLDMHGVHDMANNQGTGNSPAVTYSIDTRAPTVTSIELTGASPVLSSSGATVKVTFSESVDISDLGAVVVAPHASVTGLQSSDGGITWIGNLVPQSGTASTGNRLHVDLAQVTDKSGNGASGTVDASSTYDVTAGAPTATVMLSDHSLTQKNSVVTVTVTFNEAVNNLDPSYFDFRNADLTTFTTTDHITWQATLTSHANIHALGNTFSLDMSKVQDASGAFGSGAVYASGGYDVDTEPPTVVSLALDGGSITSTHGITLTATFSEPVGALDAGAFTTPGATLTNLTHNADSSVWTATLVASGTGSSTGNNVSLDMTKVQDLYGNAGAGSSTSSGYSVDTTVASYVQDVRLYHDSGVAGNTDSFNDAITNDARPMFTGTLNGALTGAQKVEVNIDGVTMTAPATTDGTSWYYTPTTAPLLADGSHTVSVRLVDGDHASAPITETFTVDTTAPGKLNAPVLAAADDSGSSNSDGITDTTAVHLTGTGADANAWVFLYDTTDASHEPITQVQAGSDGNWTFDLSMEGAGTYMLAAAQQDIAGNESPLSDALKLVVDLAAPVALAVPSLDPDSDTGLSSSDGVTSDSTPTFKGSGAEAFATIQLFSDSHKVGDTTADADGNWTITSDAITTAGIHSITAMQTDRAGHDAPASAAFSLNLDFDAPALTSVPGSIASNGTFSLKFSDLIQIATSIGEVDLYKDANTLVTTIQPGDAAWVTETNGSAEYTVLKLAGLADGSYHLHFTFSSPVNLVGIAATGLLHDISFNVGTTS
ncbi:MAG: Ig-like domain-containing protein [Telluria sp.]